MEFLLLGADKLKVLLSKRDMEAYSLEYENMDYSDGKTKRALLELLEQAKNEAGFQPRGAKLFIEVYPCEGGGCALYFTAIRQPPASGATAQGLLPVVFQLDDLSALFEAATKVFRRYGHRIYKSSLYRFEGKYRLVVYPLDYNDRLSVYFLSEFGVNLGEGHVFAAFTQEHGEALIEDIAIETIAEIYDGSSL